MEAGSRGSDHLVLAAMFLCGEQLSDTRGWQPSLDFVGQCCYIAYNAVGAFVLTHINEVLRAEDYQQQAQAQAHAHAGML